VLRAQLGQPLHRGARAASSRKVNRKAMFKLLVIPEAKLSGRLEHKREERSMDQGSARKEIALHHEWLHWCSALMIWALTKGKLKPP
jgi:hypothetical protein